MNYNMVANSIKYAVGSAIAGSLVMAIPAVAMATEVKVTIENMAPEEGTVLTPLWVGFHDGTFDLFNVGAAASPALERIAEDGTPPPLAKMFEQSGAGSMMGVLKGPGISPESPPVIPPGAMVSATFTLDENDPKAQFFSYASMVVPSNDAFIANGNPFAYQIFDESGDFEGADFVVYGFNIKDAGTEVNSEIPASTALLGQMQPNTGEPENGVIRRHAGFMMGGNILQKFPNADFTNCSVYPVARIRVEMVAPEPAPTDGILSPDDTRPGNTVVPGSGM